MDLTFSSSALAGQRSGCIVAPVFDRRKLSAPADALDEASDGHIRRVMASGDLDGKAETSVMLHNVPGIRAERVLLVGCGKARDLDARTFRSICAHAARELGKSRATSAVSCMAAVKVKGADVAMLARVVAETAHDAAYRFTEFKTEKRDDPEPLARLTIHLADRSARKSVEHGIAEAKAVASGVAFARDLANRPPNVCTPTHLAEQALELGQAFETITTTVLDESDMEKLGMGALLAVARGSRQPPRLIAMDYRGRDNGKPVVLVGKGVTFDTGGISIKPAAGMDEMKYDMGGAAAVFGVIRACAELELNVHVIGLVPAVENMPDGNATRPGDILHTMSGKTVEVLNTDAEGRLILCDALTYAARHEPETIIDNATLTGACIVALGHQASALLTPNDRLARDLTRAGDDSGDRCWRMPLWKDYQQQLKSPFADFANVGGPAAGTITAACFLARFTEDYKRWAHLDIAGVAWTRGDKKGATGRPVPLLMQYLLDRPTDRRARE